jgi:ATP-dependent Clp protease ATP-binding subunit ClpA
MRYSERAQLAIRFANQEAASLDHDHINTAHLLLGLMREGEGTAMVFLKSMNVDLEKMKTELESIMENKGRGSVIGQLKLTSRADNALKLAAEESQNMGHKYVGTEHMLLGIIREREGVASKTLIKFGIDLDKARSAAQTIAIDEEEPTETLTFHDVELTMPTQERGIVFPTAAFQEDVLDLEEASQLLRITVSDLSKLLETEDLPARVVAGQWRFSRSALIRWLGEGKSQNYKSTGR